MVETYEKIDGKHSVSEMLEGAKALPPALQREVILHALANSRFQFEWSWIAKECGIPSSEWPPHPGEVVQ